MLRQILVFTVLILFSQSPRALALVTSQEARVLFVIIDGVRHQETQTPLVNQFMPEFSKLKKQGLYFPKMVISNPAGVSLPAYSDIFAGRRQEKIISNRPPKQDYFSHYPTLFELFEDGFDNDSVALFSSWEKICHIAVGSKSKNKFYRSCGWSKNSVKPAPYPGVREDVDVLIEVSNYLKSKKPRFMFVHLGDADGEGHVHETVLKKTGVEYGIFHYHEALKRDDYILARIWELLQSDSTYKGKTYLVVSTDHGRDNFLGDQQFASHGLCVEQGRPLCSGCKGVFALVLGPGIVPGVVNKQYSHTDLAPTILKIFGLEMPSAKGHVMTEVFKQN